jgi:hypothetical protein
MKKIILSAALAVALSTSGMLGMGVALASPGDNGSGNGGCIDNLYGNATNARPSGNGVIPSQSPGPFVNTGVNEPPRNDRVRGISVGGVMQITTALGLNGQETMAIICTFP